MLTGLGAQYKSLPPVLCFLFQTTTLSTTAHPIPTNTNALTHNIHHHTNDAEALQITLLSEMDEFPEFEGADVRIVLTTGRQYQLHASVLRAHSPLMRDLLRPENATTLSSRAVKAGATTRWKLVLVSSPDEDTALQYELSAVELSDRGVELRGEEATVLVENENGRVTDPAFKVCFPTSPISGAYTDHLTPGVPLRPRRPACHSH